MPAERASLIQEVVQTSHFNLTAYSRIVDLDQPISVYIEGDGQAWRSRTELSPDPTPLHPLGLELAALDSHPNIVYLARPCQHTSFQMDALCKDAAYWSNKRFSEEVIVSINEAIDRFVEKTSSKKVLLNGYSGGAAVAVLVAARRVDVVSLRTVAGNLDTRSLSDYHHVSQLEGSLDPMDAASSVAHIPQIHFFGGRDRVVPASLSENFKNALGPSACAKIVRVEEAGHLHGWAEKWADLVRLPAACS